MISINYRSIPVVRKLVDYVRPKSWQQAALMVGGVAAGIFYLKHKIYPEKQLGVGSMELPYSEPGQREKQVRFGAVEFAPVYESYTPPPFPAGFAVKHPDRGSSMVILEEMSDKAVTIRFQDDEHPLVIPTELFLKWKPERKW